MKKYIEYELDNDATLFLEASDDIGGVVDAARGDGIFIKSKKKFREALADAKLQASILLDEIEGLNVDEAEIKFGITTTGEVGILAIGKIGADVNYEVILKWKSRNFSENGQ